VICLGNPKLNGGSIIEVDKAKTTLTLVCEVTFTGSSAFGVGTKLLSGPATYEALQNTGIGVDANP